MAHVPRRRRTMPTVLHEVLTLSRPIVVLDTESTGTYPARDRIVEVAFVKIHPDGRREVFHRRVHPTVPIPPESTRIHGISDADVAGLPTFGGVAREIADFLSGCDLAGYNIEGFDLPILQIELARAGIELDLAGVSIVDAQLVFHKEESRTLADAMRLYVGREHENAHSALADAEATALVIAGQLGRYPQMPRTPAGVAARYPPPRGRRVDPEGKLVVRDGTIYVNFGKKHHGKSFDQVHAEEPGFFDWVLAGDFSPAVKRCVREYLSARRAAPSVR
ncbi:MAG TPA: 3'-5' exonuclease [Thermoanaerobaculia bacterium]|nr:3'-5' exonuclease [Thermoanaerobaculia bacterium]